MLYIYIPTYMHLSPYICISFLNKHGWSFGRLTQWVSLVPQTRGVLPKPGFCAKCARSPSNTIAGPRDQDQGHVENRSHMSTNFAFPIVSIQQPLGLQIYLCAAAQHDYTYLYQHQARLPYNRLGCVTKMRICIKCLVTIDMLGHHHHTLGHDSIVCNIYSFRALTTHCRLAIRAFTFCTPRWFVVPHGDMGDEAMKKSGLVIDIVRLMLACMHASCIKHYVWCKCVMYLASFMLHYPSILPMRDA